MGLCGFLCKTGGANLPQKLSCPKKINKLFAIYCEDMENNHRLIIKLFGVKLKLKIG